MATQNSINNESDVFSSGSFISTQNVNITAIPGDDPYVSFQPAATPIYAFGIDESDANSLKITDGADPSSGAEILKIDAASNITFNNAFTFPTTDGTINQVLVTDGAGALSWYTQPVSIPGKLVQAIYSSDNTLKGPYTTIFPIVSPFTGTPTITGGTELMSVTITPTDAASTLVIEASVFIGSFAAGSVFGPALCLFKDAIVNTIGTMVKSEYRIYNSLADFTRSDWHRCSYSIVAGSTVAQKFSLRAGILNSTVSANRTFAMNGHYFSASPTDVGRILGGTITSYMNIYEFAP